MTNSVIKMVQSIEADYGMNPNNWPENDARLKALKNVSMIQLEIPRTGIKVTSYIRDKSHIENKNYVRRNDYLILPTFQNTKLRIKSVTTKIILVHYVQMDI